MAQFKLKSNVVTNREAGDRITTIKGKSRKAKVVDFSGYKPSSVTYGHRRHKDPSFEELFGHQRRTTGSDIQLIRVYMHMEGLPEIPEDLAVHEFATVFARFVLPRCKWPHFVKRDTPKARKFLSKWAMTVLPRININEKPKPQPMIYKSMVQSAAALYNPYYLDRGVTQ